MTDQQSAISTRTSISTLPSSAAGAGTGRGGQERFGVAVGHFHQRPVGPHPARQRSR